MKEIIISREDYFGSRKADQTVDGTNDTSIIQQALNDLANTTGSKKNRLIFRPGRYTIDQTIKGSLLLNVDIIGEEGAELYFSNSNAQFLIELSGRVLVQGITLTGTAPADRDYTKVINKMELLRIEVCDEVIVDNVKAVSSWMSGIGLINCGQGEVVSCHGYDCIQNGLVVWENGNPFTRKGITVVGFLADNNGLDGINIAAGYVTLHGCKSTRTGVGTPNDPSNGYHFPECNKGPIQVIGCQSKDNTLCGFECDTGVKNESVGVVFEGCVAENNGKSGAAGNFYGFLANVNNIMFRGCISISNVHGGFAIRSQNVPTGNEAHRCIISGCIAKKHSSAGQYGIVEMRTTNAVNPPNSNIIDNVILEDNNTQIVAGSQFLDVNTVATKSGNTTIVGNKIEYTTPPP